MVCTAAGDERVTVHVAYSRPEPDDVRGRDYDSEGRVDGALLDALGERRVPDERIHTETFGPSSG